MKNHKEILENLLSELDSMETVGLYWDRNWQQIRETSHNAEYIKVEDLNRLIKEYKGNLTSGN
jgi:hypothetical protein